MPVTIDGPTLTITEIANGADNTVDVVDIYSTWKQWVIQSDNAKYPPAFRVIGGDPISPSQNVGSTFFFNVIDGWRIIPADLDHQLTLVGNIIPDGGTGNIFGQAPGRTVTTRVNFSNLVDSTVSGGEGSGGGLTAEQILRLEEIHYILGLDVSRPLVVTSSRRTAGSSIVQDITESQDGSVTIQRK
jgi:hypothetical protein